MDARLTPTQHTALRNLQRALYNDADWVGTSVDRHDGTAHRTRVDDRDAMRFLADALGDALDTDDARTLEPAPQQTAEQAATTIGRRGLQDFLDQIHQPGVSSAIVMYASKNTGGQAVCTTTATALQNLLDDANLAPAEHTTLDVPAAVSFDGQIPGRNYREFAAWWNASTASGQCALWTRLDRLMREDTERTPRNTLTEGVTDTDRYQTLTAWADRLYVASRTNGATWLTLDKVNHTKPGRDLDRHGNAAWLLRDISDAITAYVGRDDDTDTEPETKSSDLGMATDPDPYGIDLRGPHNTSRPSADRAIYGGLNDLDDRTRNLYRTLLRQTLTNLRNTDHSEDPL